MPEGSSRPNIYIYIWCTCSGSHPTRNPYMRVQVCRGWRLASASSLLERVHPFAPCQCRLSRRCFTIGHGVQFRHRLFGSWGICWSSRHTPLKCCQFFRALKISVYICSRRPSSVKIQGPWRRNEVVFHGTSCHLPHPLFATRRNRGWIFSTTYTVRIGFLRSLGTCPSDNCQLLHLFIIAAYVAIPVLR